MYNLPIPLRAGWESRSKMAAPTRAGKDCIQSILETGNEAHDKTDTDVDELTKPLEQLKLDDETPDKELEEDNRQSQFKMDKTTNPTMNPGMLYSTECSSDSRIDNATAILTSVDKRPTFQSILKNESGHEENKDAIIDPSSQAYREPAELDTEMEVADKDLGISPRHGNRDMREIRSLVSERQHHAGVKRKLTDNTIEPSQDISKRTKIKNGEKYDARKSASSIHRRTKRKNGSRHSINKSRGKHWSLKRRKVEKQCRPRPINTGGPLYRKARKIVELFMRVLDPNVWLSDQHMDVIMDLLSKYGIASQSVLFGHRAQSPAADAKFIQIMHVRGNHWLVVSNINCPRGVLYIYDSGFAKSDLGTKEKEILALLSFYHTDDPQLIIKWVDVAQQQGVNDCGLYAIANSIALARGSDPSTLIYDQTKMREHLLSVIVSIAKGQNVSPFPIVKHRPHSEEFLHCEVIKF